MVQLSYPKPVKARKECHQEFKEAFKPIVILLYASYNHFKFLKDSIAESKL